MGQIFSRQRYLASKSYTALDRWCSYWHQLDFVSRSCEGAMPATLLEVGVGVGVVSSALSGRGIAVSRVDIDASLHPDFVLDVRELASLGKQFDTVLAAEILEHIPWGDVPRALVQIRRVAAHGVVLSLPRPGYIFSFAFKLPLIARQTWLGKIPFFWKRPAPVVHEADHYWELGYRGYPVQSFIALAQAAGLRLEELGQYQDDPAHFFFRFSVAH